MQKRSSYYAQHSATPAFLIVSEGLVQVLWKREDILNSFLWFKMSSKSKIISERHISHIKHKHMQRVYLLIICSAFLWAAHLKAKHADELGTSPFPRKTILGARQWFLINALTAKMMGKGSAACRFFLQRKVQWLMCQKEHANQRLAVHFTSDHPKCSP